MQAATFRVAVARRWTQRMRELYRLFGLFLVATLVMASAYGAGFASGLDRRANGQAPAAADTTTAPPTEGARDDFAVFWEAAETVQSNFYGELPEPDRITYGAIRGSLRALEDPYTVFSDPQDTAINRVTLDGQFEGIGAYVNQNEAGQLVIQTPMQGQPAERAGLAAGDIVIKVDGRDIAGLNINEAVLLIRGPKGTTVELTVLREEVAGALTFSVVRDRIEIPSVTGDRLLADEGEEDIAYIQITEFAADTRDELIPKLDQLRQAGAKALILDVRNNPGGFLTTSIEVVSQFIDRGVVVIQEDSSGRRRQESARRGGHWLDLPLVLLVNRGSASASEILAGAIADHGRGTVVGETTFGKGSVQNVHSLQDESQLRVTVAVWLTPSGNLIHEQGIRPHIEASISAADREAERDPQLEAAIAEARRLIDEAGR